jgi:hypothetical protein
MGHWGMILKRENRRIGERKKSYCVLLTVKKTSVEHVNNNNNNIFIIKVKTSRYRPGVAQRVPGS